jgi:hypothetical protein
VRGHGRHSIGKGGCPAGSSANDGAFGLVITLSPVHEEQDGVIA